MSQPEPPAAWREAMARKGITSARDLAGKAEVSPNAVYRLIRGEGKPREDVVSKVATTLGISVKRVRAHVAVPAGEESPFVLPPEANRLNARQRKALTELVRAIVEPGNDAPPPALVEDAMRVRDARDDQSQHAVKKT